MSSNVDRSALAQDIAARARSLAGQERAQFLKRACGGDEQLSAEVDALLARSNDVEPETVVSQMEPGSGLDSLRDMLGRVSARVPERSRYRIDGELARGGMGAILRVWDQDLNRPLAMKVALDMGPLAASSAAADHDVPTGDPRALARFLEEAQVTSQLDHPGIVPVHELGLDSKGRVYFTMKLVKGVTLRQVFDELSKGTGDWTQTRVLGLLLKVCEAMAYAHSKGVIHRDLKPANIMVGRYGEVYVMDWGLSRVMTKEERRDLRLDLERAGLDKAELTAVVSTELKRLRELAPDEDLVTMDGTVVGTPCYMPPEQALADSSSLGPRTDVYALGAILYHLLTGALPYVPRGKRLSPHVVFMSLIHGPPPPVRKLAPAAPEELAAICEKAMAHEASARYASAVELAADIQAYLEHRPVSARRHSLREVARLAYERNKPIVLTATAGLVAFLVAVGISIWQLSNEVRRTKEANTKLETANAERERNAALSASRALLVESDELTIVPSGLPKMRAWLEQVRFLIGRHEALRAEGARTPPGSILGSQISQAVANIDTLAALVPRVEDWIEIAASLEVRMREKDAKAWNEARASIAASKLYGGLDLAPQVGLVPLHENPQSGLWEFWHVASGKRPEIDTWRDDRYELTPESGIVLVLLPAGTFTAGDVSGNMTYRGEAEFSVEASFLGKYEVTQGQWQRIMGRNDAYYAAGRTLPASFRVESEATPFTELHPIELVDWHAATRFCTRLGMTLPREVYWEYACRAGTTTLWCWGGEERDLEGHENLRDQENRLVAGKNEDVFSPWNDGYPVHSPVGSFDPNPFGLFDMHGNVGEWCGNAPDEGHWLHDYDVVRFIRGGSWNQPAEYWSCAAWRTDRPKSEVFIYVGVRVARAIDP